jgi:acetoin:2,6-dichlorophenolindophenol oxidoreductase subunit alpha
MSMPALASSARLAMFERMLVIRRYEEQLSRIFFEGKVPGSLDLCLGQEAVAVGACFALRGTDWITSTHRGHGHMLAKGADLARLTAELLGRQAGYCKGKGGSMHVASAQERFLAFGIVGGGVPIAAGLAFAANLLDEDNVAVCFTGDGAVNQGQFHETFNLASLWKIPVIYVCENNQYATTTRSETVTASASLAKWASGYGMPGIEVDGNDVLAVHAVVEKAVARARSGQGPTFIEAMTYRVSPQVEGEERVFATRNPYRSQEEIDRWRGVDRDPIARFEHILRNAGVLEDATLAVVEGRVRDVIEQAFEVAMASPAPAPNEALEDVFAGEYAV